MEKIKNPLANMPLSELTKLHVSETKKFYSFIDKQKEKYISKHPVPSMIVDEIRNRGLEKELLSEEFIKSTCHSNVRF